MMSLPDTSTTSAATPSATPINLDETESTTQTHRLAATTKEIPKLQKLEETTTKQSNQLSTQTQKIATAELAVSSTITTTTIAPKSEAPTGEDSDLLLIQEVDPQPKPKNGFS